jgi:hypothetical protein
VTVAAIIARAQMVAHFAAQFDDWKAAEVLTWTDEPGLLAEPGVTPPRFHWAAIEAARLISYDGTAAFRDGQPRHFTKGVVPWES